MDLHELSEEEKLIWEYFNFSEKGYFIEVGANDPKNLSQTYYLEKKGWEGLLIEPQPVLCKKLKNARSAKVLPVACGAPEDKGEAEFFIAGEFSGLKKHQVFTDIHYTGSITIFVTTLDDILEEEGNPAIDLLSIDVEGYELNVLKGLNLQKHRPELIFVEYHVISLALHKHLVDNKYKLIRRTGVNNWYIPKDKNFVVPFYQRLKLFRKMYLGTPLRILQFKIKKLKHSREFRD